MIVEILKNKDFMKIWLAQLASQLAANLLNFALIIRVFELSANTKFANISVSLLVLAFGVPGVEYTPHLFEIPTRIAREFLYLGQKMKASRAYEVGMINRVVPGVELLDEAMRFARVIAGYPAHGMATTKRLI